MDLSVNDRIKDQFNTRYREDYPESFNWFYTKLQYKFRESETDSINLYRDKELPFVDSNGKVDLEVLAIILRLQGFHCDVREGNFNAVLSISIKY